MFNNTPSGFEGEELAMMNANRRHDAYVKARRNNIILNATVGVMSASLIVLSFATGVFAFALPFMFWAGWNAEKLFRKN